MNAAHATLRHLFQSRQDSQDGKSTVQNEAMWRATNERNRQEANVLLEQIGV